MVQAGPYQAYLALWALGTTLGASLVFYILANFHYCHSSLKKQRSISK